jgi:hypothetical protein
MVWTFDKKVYEHWKPEGTDFSQALSRRLSVIGTFKLIPRTLALIAVQRQIAASKSTKPWSNAQHLLEAGLPTIILTSPRTSAHTPSFNVSVGQFCDVEGVGGVAEGVGGHGVGEAGGGLGFGFGLGLGDGVGLHEPQACENVA